MKKYHLVFSRTQYQECIVEGENEEDAIDRSIEEDKKTYYGDDLKVIVKEVE